MDVEVALVFFVNRRMRLSQELHVTFCHMKSKVARAFSPRALRPRENSTTTPRLTVTGFGSGFASHRTAAPHADPGEGVNRARTHPLDPSRARAARTRSRLRTATQVGVHGIGVVSVNERTREVGAKEKAPRARPIRVTWVASRRPPDWSRPALALTRARACRRRVARLVVPRPLRAPAPRWAAGS